MGSRILAITLCLLAPAALLLPGCSRSKRLSGADDGVLESMLYGVLGMDRNAQEYYRIVRESHDRRFQYRVSQDEFQVDRVVDAVQRLGQLEYERPEGQAQVVSLLADVLVEDPSALAQASAATSLTRLDLRLPRTAVQRLPERGDRLLAALRELDAMHAAGRVPSQAERRRRVELVEAIGRMQLPTLGLAQDALKPFYTRAYLVEAGEGALRRAAERAMVLRMQEATRLALRAGVDLPTDFVREEAVRGLKVIEDRGAEATVLDRLIVERDARVRAEIVEYLGMSRSARSVAALLPLLEDTDPTLRVKAREALTRIAGRDLGLRRATWTRWARGRHAGRPAAVDSGAPNGSVR